MAADYKSAQLTSLATVGAELAPGLYNAGLRFYYGRIDLSAVTDGWDKSETAAMFTFRTGDIPLAIGLIAGVSLGSAKVSIGPTGTAAKYRALAVFTAVNIMSFHSISAPAALTADEEVWVTNDATADMPTTTYLALLGVYSRH